MHEYLTWSNAVGSNGILMTPDGPCDLLDVLLLCNEEAEEGVGGGTDA